MARMGYAYSVYAVDLKKLKRLWGKRDKKLGKALRAKHAEDIKQNTDWFDDAIAERGSPTLGRAIHEILDGKCAAKGHGFQYGYAVELLCRELGGRVDEVSLTWFDDVLDPLLKRAKQPALAKLLGKGVRPMPIPAPADFPEIGTIEPAGLVKLDAALAKLDDGGDENTKMVIDEVRGWCARAKKQKRGVVWFVY